MMVRDDVAVPGYDNTGPGPNAEEPIFLVISIVEDGDRHDRRYNLRSNSCRIDGAPEVVDDLSGNRRYRDRLDSFGGAHDRRGRCLRLLECPGGRKDADRHGGPNDASSESAEEERNTAAFGFGCCRLWRGDWSDHRGLWCLRYAVVVVIVERDRGNRSGGGRGGVSRFPFSVLRIGGLGDRIHLIHFPGVERRTAVLFLFLLMADS